MNLMTIDVQDTRAIRWPEGVPPIVPRPRTTSATPQLAPTSDACSCRAQTLGHHWPMAATTVPSWVSTPAWPGGLPESEIQKEECRRLIWSSIQLLAGYNSYSVARGVQVVEFALCKASNVSLIHASLLPPQLNEILVCVPLSRGGYRWSVCERYRLEYILQSNDVMEWMHWDEKGSKCQRFRQGKARDGGLDGELRVR